MIPYPAARNREAIAKRMVDHELPAGWTRDAEAYFDRALRRWIACASGPNFRMCGGSGRTRVEAWEALAHDLRWRRATVVRPSRLAGLLILLSLAMLALSAPIEAADPAPTPVASTPTPYPLLGWQPVPTWPGVFASPEPTPTVAPKTGKASCANPATSTDRRRGNSPAAQAYLRSRLSRSEYWCAWQIVLQESGWRPDAGYLRAMFNGSACGFPQASPCSKLANWIKLRHPDAPTYTYPGSKLTFALDWRAYPTDQLDWMIWYVGHNYGSFLAAACFKFGCGDGDGSGYY